MNSYTGCELYVYLIRKDMTYIVVFVNRRKMRVYNNEGLVRDWTPFLDEVRCYVLCIRVYKCISV